MGNSKSDDETLWELLKELEPPRDADVFSHLPIERQVLLAESRAPQDAADLLEAMPSDDCVDLVQQLAPEAPVLLLGSLAEPALAVCPLNVASRWRADAPVGRTFCTRSAHFVSSSQGQGMRLLHGPMHSSISPRLALP
jgi:hypothetical protein